MQQLKDAVKEFGGEIHFGYDYSGEYASGTERPIVLVNPSKWDCNPQDVYVNFVKIDKDNHMTILAETKDGYAFFLDTDDIEFGHASFITDLIPVEKRQLVLETAVIMAGDMFGKMYDADKGRGTFEVCHEIIRLAKEFENTRKWRPSDEDYDEGKYFDELEEFEKRYLDNIDC